MSTHRLLSPVWALALLPLCATLALAQGNGKPTLVTVTPVLERTVQEERTFVGTVITRRTVRVGAAASGRVLRVLVEEGQRVEANAVLAELERDVIEARLAAARAELERKRAELEELVAGARPEELEAAAARTEAARLRLELAKRRLARVQSLYERGGARDEELDDAATAVEQASQLLREAEAQYRLLRAGTRAERIAQARAALRSQEAIVRELQREYDKHLIRAPFTGYVVAKLTEAGAWLRQGDAVIELMELDELYVEAPVPEQDVARLASDAPARVTFDSLPDRAFPATRLIVIPRAIPATRNFPVRVVVRNVFDDRQQPLIRIGYSARVTLPTGPRLQATLVPKDALLLNTNPPLIYVVPPGTEGKMATARAVPVSVAAFWQKWVAVEGEVQPGEWVVIRGNERLSPNQQVTVGEVIPSEQLLEPDNFRAELRTGSN